MPAARFAGVRVLAVLAALAFAVLLPGCATIAPRPVPPAPMSAEDRQAHNRRVFDRAWDLVNRRFFDAHFRGIDWPAMAEKYRAEARAAADDEALYGVINRMLAELGESHNVAFTPRESFERKTEKRALVGLGLRHLESRWVVDDVVPGSPAAEAGVRRGWIIAARQGEPLTKDLRPLPLEPGQEITYEFIDAEDRAHTITMKARLIAPSHRREARVLDDGFVYLRFDDFSRSSRRWFSEQLKRHRDAPGVVIDLRRNPGGQAFSLLIVMGEVFPRQVPMGAFIRRSGRAIKADSFAWLPARYSGKMAVLIDGQSASCSEIFAHVLQHHKRAALVGRKTAGAVIASRFYSLPGGGDIQIGIQDYVGLDGRRLEKTGVTPDVPVELKLSDFRQGADADLTAAMKVLREGGQGARRERVERSD